MEAGLISEKMQQLGMDTQSLRRALGEEGVAVTYQTAWNWQRGTRPSDTHMRALRRVLRLTDGEVLQILDLAAEPEQAATGGLE